MNLHKPYAQYMITWIEYIDHTLSSELSDTYARIKEYWINDGPAFDVSETKEILWSWVDNNGGPGIVADKDMLLARMAICVSTTDENEGRELREMGFFEDLLEHYGFSREEINKTSPDNLPGNF